MRIIKYREAIREAIREEMKKDPILFIIGEDVGPFGGAMRVSEGLWDEFGDDRVKDAPISEAAIVGCGLGASLTGCRAIVEIQYSDFMTIAMDQILNQASKMRYMFGGKAKVPLVIRAPIGGYTHQSAQHSQCPEAVFAHFRGIKVAMPSNPYDAKGLLKTAINDNNLVIFFEHKVLYTSKCHVPEEEYFIPFGEAIIKRPGKDLTIVAISYMVQMSLKAADILSQERIEAEVIDLRTLVPIDEKTILSSVIKTGRAIIIHESWKNFGVGAEIVSLITEKAFDSLNAPVIRVAAESVPIPYSPVLESFVLPSEKKIVFAAKSLF